MANSTSSFFLCLLFVAFVDAKYDQKRVPDYIRSEGYPVEEHFVTTRSGYILGLHRIPFGKLESNATRDKAGKPVVLLQHGFARSSDSRVLLGSKKALGFGLADRGYDVWMSNSRGNKYSTNHTKYNMSRSSDSKKFYDYSFHEKGVEDLPTTIDYILRATDRNDLSLYNHSSQSVLHGKLRKFNFGNFNVLHFQLFVPVYNLDRVRVPSHIFYGGQDLVVSPASVNTTLYKQLSAEPPRMYFARHFGHYDFIYGRDAFNDVYNVTLDLLEEYVKG